MQVIPGIFVALMLRKDVSTGFRCSYFQSAFGGYVLGLGATIVVMNVFNAAQVRAGVRVYLGGLATNMHTFTHM